MEDLIYYFSLVVFILLGNYYRTLEDPNMKRCFGAGLGILLACLICGIYVYHSFLIVFVNICIIKNVSGRNVHKWCMLVTWLHLVYLHQFVLTSIYMRWFHQTLALRVVGLAFEVNAEAINAEPKAFQFHPPVGGVPKEIHPVDIITYAFFFIGLHRGPYYRWKIFNDHFNNLYGTIGDCRSITEKKLKKACLFCLGYILLRVQYSPYIYYEDYFYRKYDMDHRFLANIPQLVMFFLTYKISAILETCVCTETGFGLYPESCHAIPGHGPTAQPSLLLMISSDPKLAMEQDYNFAMLRCFDTPKLFLGPRMKNTVRAWDLPTQYWFTQYTYKRLLRGTKYVRSSFSLLSWTLWRGLTLPNLLFSGTLWIYLQLETELNDVYNNGSMQLSWDVGFCIMRLLCLVYLTPCLVVHEADWLVQYYCSVYWSYHGGLLTLAALTLLVHQLRRTPSTTTTT